MCHCTSSIVSLFQLLGHMMMVVKKLAKEQGLADEGYRVGE